MPCLRFWPTQPASKAGSERGLSRPSAGSQTDPHAAPHAGTNPSRTRCTAARRGRSGAATPARARETELVGRVGFADPVLDHRCWLGDLAGPDVLGVGFRVDPVVALGCCSHRILCVVVGKVGPGVIEQIAGSYGWAFVGPHLLGCPPGAPRGLGVAGSSDLDRACRGADDQERTVGIPADPVYE